VSVIQFSAIWGKEPFFLPFTVPSLLVDTLLLSSINGILSLADVPGVLAVVTVLLHPVNKQARERTIKAIHKIFFIRLPPISQKVFDLANVFSVGITDLFCQ